MNKSRRIDMAGLIGVGKTTCAKKIAKLFDFEFIGEPQLNINSYMGNILGDFYGDKKKYGFLFQIFLCSERIKQYQNLKPGNNYISDRSVYEDLIFSHLLMEQGFIERREYLCHKNVIFQMMELVPKPEKLIYLKCNPETSFERIKMRGREEEKLITLDYIKALSEEYDKFFYDSKILKKLGINVCEIDYNIFNDSPLKQI